MNAPSLLADDDSAPTLVMHTRLIDRRAMPAAQHVPSTPAPPPTAWIQSYAPSVAPPSHGPSSHGPSSHGPSSHGPSSSSSPASASPDATQPARRIKREHRAYRRLAISLGIALAFASGTAASFAVQSASAPARLHERQPRAAISRSASLRLLDGADAKAEPRDDVSARNAPSAQSAPNVHAPSAQNRASVVAAPHARGAKAAPAASATQSTEESLADPAVGNLLDRGLAGD